MKYIVTNSTGINIRKTMSTYNNYPVGKLNKSSEFMVFQEENISEGGLIYTWGRISENPDENGQHRYVALKRTGKDYCKPVVVPSEIPQSDFEDLLKRVERLEKLAGI